MRLFRRPASRSHPPEAPAKVCPSLALQAGVLIFLTGIISPRRLPRWGLGLAILTVGCNPGRVPFGSVRGQVSFKGVPLPAGLIVFTPDPTRGHRGPLACAEIQADGRYDLRTEDQAGAAPGWYRVTLGAGGSSRPATRRAPCVGAPSVLPGA